jgi:hypothetical protein
MAHFLFVNLPLHPDREPGTVSDLTRLGAGAAPTVRYFIYSEVLNYGIPLFHPYDK